MSLSELENFLFSLFPDKEKQLQKENAKLKAKAEKKKRIENLLKENEKYKKDLEGT
jgi:hypothetical protein